MDLFEDTSHLPKSTRVTTNWRIPLHIELTVAVTAHEPEILTAL